MSLNPYQKKRPRLIGTARSNRIIKLLESLRALTTEQIYLLEFRPAKVGLRMTQRKLTELYKKKKINRTRLSYYTPCIYFLERKSQWEHIIAVNWVYMWLKTKLRPGEKVTYWKTELRYGYLRPDALVGIGNGTDNTYYYIELDRPSRAPWNKAGKYNQYFEELDKPVGFPTILCVATEEKRAAKIKEGIAQSNRHNLKFLVLLLDDLIKEVKASDT